MNVALPENLPLLINDPRHGAREAVSNLLCNGCNSLKDALSLIGKYWKVKIWFESPVDVMIHKYWKKEIIDGKPCEVRVSYRTDTVHVFNKLILSADGCLYYAISRRSHIGYPFEWLNKIVKYEPVIEYKTDVFNSFEEFAAKFDLNFITIDEIKRLWNQGSCQHGGQYRPSDFRAIGPVGRKVMENFLKFFKGVNAGGEGVPEGYTKSPYGDYYVLTTSYHSYHRSGRDITISHCTGQPYVSYSSEFSGCGNGRYGLVANKHTFLWIEDD